MSKNKGYGKPPKAHQFKPGQSGNPKGRPKGAKSLKTVLRTELSEKIEIKVQGKTQKVTKLEAFIKRLMNDALSGKAKAQSEILKLTSAYQETEEMDDKAPSVSDAEDQALIEAFMKRMNSKMLKESENDETQS